MTCLLGQSGPWEFQVITPRHELLLCSLEQEPEEASGSRGRCWEAGGRHVGDREGVRRGPGGAGEVRVVWKRSGRPWESAEEAGRHRK